MNNTHLAALSLVATAVFVLLSANVSLVQADTDTVGYWRFESEAGFLEDSGPNDLDLSITGSPAPTHYALPETGYGENFSDPIPQTGQSNNGAADFSASSSGGYLAHPDDDLFELHDFTFEVFFNRANNSVRSFLGGQYDTGSSQRSWGFGVRDSSVGNSMFLYACKSGATSQYTHSDFAIDELEHDYYAAVTFDESDTETGLTFYLKDLTAGTPLQVDVQGHNVSTSLFNSSAEFAVGALAGGNYNFQGILDEARLSNGVVPQSELLISVPEPGMIVLLCSLLLGLVYLNRRRS